MLKNKPNAYGTVCKLDVKREECDSDDLYDPNDSRDWRWAAHYGVHTQCGCNVWNHRRSCARHYKFTQKRLKLHNRWFWTNLRLPQVSHQPPFEELEERSGDNKKYYRKWCETYSSSVIPCCSLSQKSKNVTKPHTIFDSSPSSNFKWRYRHQTHKKTKKLIENNGYLGFFARQAKKLRDLFCFSSDHHL